MLTYGIGYRMCAGSLLANRELYLIFMRTINSFRIEPYDEFDWHPVYGNSDPTSLVAIPNKYKVRFIPKDKKVLENALGLASSLRLGG
jgi:3-hydroxyphenylacetate 6-hydroxylase